MEIVINCSFFVVLWVLSDFVLCNKYGGEILFFKVGVVGINLFV